MKSRDLTIIVFILQGEVDDDSFLISMLLGTYVEKKKIQNNIEIDYDKW